MDSVTQIVLGSAVGYAFLGRRLGRKALLVGAGFGTLPDLDVLIDFGGTIENFVSHRSFSHSLIVQLLLSPLFAWALQLFRFAKVVTFKQLSLAVFLILCTHSLLDSFTVYGTQLLWPLTDYPFGISSIFIIDPFYTLPLLISTFAICFIRIKPYANKINVTALSVSSLYLTWGLVAKWHIDNKIAHSLANQAITYQSFESTPSPFNTLLWRAVAMTEKGHFEIYASIFDSSDEVSFRFIKTENALLDSLPKSERVNNLISFTKGLYGVYVNNQQVIISDLRMGVEGAYVFSFVVGEQAQHGFVKGDYTQLDIRPPLNKVGLIFERITDPDINLYDLTAQ